MERAPGGSGQVGGGGVDPRAMELRHRTSRRTGTRLIASMAVAVAIGGAAVAGAVDLQPLEPASPVAMRDDDGGAAMFTVRGLAPGDVERRCIAITVDHGAPAAVSLAATGSGPAMRYLKIEIDAGTGGSHSSCSGFDGRRLYTGSLEELLAAHPNGRGLDAWTAEYDGQSAAFRISAELLDVPAAQGLAGDASFTWHGVPIPVTPPATPTVGPVPTPGAVERPPAPAPPGAPSPRQSSSPSPPTAASQRSVGPAVTSTGPSMAPAGALPPAAASAAGPSGSAGAAPSEVDPGRPDKAGSTTVPGSSDGSRGARSPHGRDGERSVLQKTLAAAQAFVVDAARAAASAAKRAAFPALLALLILLFVAFQDVLDRRDPKLARSPLRRAAMLSFSPPPADGVKR